MKPYGTAGHRHLSAVVTRSTRTVAVRLSTAYPDQAVFRLLVQRLTAG